MLLSLAVVLNGSLILVCIFFPKIYAIYRVAQSQQHLSQTFRAIRGVKRFRSRTFNEELGRKIEVAKEPERQSVEESHATRFSGTAQMPSGGEMAENPRGQCDDGECATSSENEENHQTELSEEKEGQVKHTANGFRFVVQ